MRKLLFLLGLFLTTSALAAPATQVIILNGGTVVGASNPLPVSATITPTALQDVNITKVAGAAVATGHGTAAAALRVELPTDGTGVVGLAAGSTVAVTNAGTFAVQAAQSGTWTVTGAGGSFPITAASGAIASGAYASGSISDGAEVTLGAKADAKNAATDATAITVMQVMKEISFMEQNPASRAVTNAGTFATQSAITAASGAIASGAIASGAIASGAVASGAYASGSISDGAMVTLGAKTDAKNAATDATAITIMQVLKEISFMAQTPAALPANQSMNEAQVNGVTPLMGNGVTGTGSQRVTIASDNTAFSVNATLQTQTDTVMVGGVNIKEINGVTPLMGAGNTGTGSPRVTIATDQAAIPDVATASASAVGATLFTVTLANSTNATNVKASAGSLYSISGFNMSSATPVWISLYNTAGTPTCGTGIIQQFLIPGSTTGTGFVYSFTVPKTFATGIGFCATTGIAGTGSVAASTYVLNIDYK